MTSADDERRHRDRGQPDDARPGRGPEGRDQPTDEDYRRGRPDHHDPTGGFAGAPPAQSALTLRLLLAGFGLVVGVALTFWAVTVDAPVWVVALPVLLALTAVVDIVVILRRKRRGEPG
ncbi:DUF6343 family protein [Georgenia sp. 10Sc9-8]|uniref:DUF6343 family protein n=1 Tax=Georgenia halotolerans TaxID=3028317 RepID=A0ABT5U0U5_9MICO|nr:DUF6343 family protein [Georgenia halotolerans]